MTDETPETPAQKRARRRVQKQRQEAWYTDLFSDVPADFTPLEGVAAIKCLAEDGNVCLMVVKTSGLAAWEAFGMLAYASDDFSSATINACTEDDD